MKPYPHQEKIFKEAFPILEKYGIVCLSMEERTGKTLIALLLAEAASEKNILILTKKKALPGWQEHLDKFPVTKNYELVNYHSIHKVKNKPDLVIFDEAHYVLSGFPKPGKIMKEVRKITYQCRGIYLSATFSAQSFSQLYHIFATTKYSPWREYRSFYRWADRYVEPYTVWISGREVKKYDRTVPGLYEEVEHLFISYTRKELGFEHEPEDVLHYVNLSEETKSVFKSLKNDGIWEDIVADTPMSLMTKLHQLEGGVVLQGKELHYFGAEKLDYLKKTFGDRKDLCIMAHYIGEQELLKKEFKKALVLSATAYAEGVDLSHYKDLVIYSQGFSTAQHKQRRARQCNKQRKEPIKVHYLLVKGGVSGAVYRTVSINGKNFVDRYYLSEKERVAIRKKLQRRKTNEN